MGASHAGCGHGYRCAVGCVKRRFCRFSIFSKQILEKLLSAGLVAFQGQIKKSEIAFDTTLKRGLDFRAQQLTDFYWPIYIRLQKDNAIWHRILDKKSADEKLSLIATEIESKEILPNHNQIVEIIQSKIHLAQASADLQSALMQYVRHVSVYKAMRASGDNVRFPLDIGEVWPNTLFDLIESRTNFLQSEFDDILLDSLGNGSVKYINT